MQGQAKKQTENKRLELLPVIFLLEFLPHGKRGEAANPGCRGGRSGGKLVEGF